MTSFSHTTRCFFYIRTASVDRYYGAYLVQKAKSIVITLNFKLGFFEFAYLGHQRMALKWIRIAIEFFWGNKNAIMPIEIGSGGYSVSAHLFSDTSYGLFHRAIVSSGQ
uniref:COesterase domain-containing protein n=1 Tax=Strongyloides papillosus TaxID=174720 RepID=A0A0N5C731_STREA